MQLCEACGNLHLVNDILANPINLAKDLCQDCLNKIGERVVQDYDADEKSRAQWLERYERSMKLALQVMETKNFPWKNAANIKYPLLTTAAIQFHARAFPALVPGNKKVLARVIGNDADGSKEARAERVSTYMDYQLGEEMENWEEDTDRLCLILPILGCAFKKTYYDALNETNVSELVLPKYFVVNYWTKTLNKCPCATHILEMRDNDIYEYQAAGLFVDCDLGESANAQVPKVIVEGQALTSDTTGQRPVEYRTKPRYVLEQHRYLDLDGDGYEEPYVCTVDYSTHKVLRIVANFELADVKFSVADPEKVTKINYESAFTKFSFIPNPDGGFYDVGFGLLLGSINEAANTILNQLVDSGTLNNLQAGFLSKGIKIKSGEKRFGLGEWKVVESTLDDLKKGIMPLPTNQPSQVLYNLLTFLLDAGKQLATTTDITLGESPGQNQPFQTTQAVMEQGAKVFTAIYKRLHRALASEYKKLFKLNGRYLDEKKEFTILDIKDTRQAQVMQSDFTSDGSDIVPNSDPNTTTMSQKLMKAQMLMAIPGLNPDEVKRRILEAQEQPNIEALLNVPPAQPDAKQIEAMERARYHNIRGQIEIVKTKIDGVLKFAQAKNQIAQADATDAKAQIDELMAHLNVLTAALPNLQQDGQQEGAPGEEAGESPEQEQQEQQQGTEVPTQGE